MLVSSKKILKAAQKGRYAIGQFNTSDLEVTKAIIQAAEKMGSPVIVGVTEKAITYAGLENLAEIVKNEAEKVKIAVVLHLDHGKSYKIVKECLDFGFTSVMIDGSRLPLKDNISLTKKVVNLTHKKGITCEGEIGTVPYPNRNLAFTIPQVEMTDPREAEEFVRKTGIDSLAISIGNVHGLPLPDEKLDFNLLKEIRAKVKIPLVLHGASGTPKIQIKKAISLGIAKINIDTDIRLAFHSSLKQFLIYNPDIYNPREILGSTMEAIRKLVQAKIQIFGSEGKG